MRSMAPPVKRQTMPPTGQASRRPYDASGRRAASAETRRRILESARSQLVERGYSGATVARIAESAGVNADTVYTLVGRKPVIVRTLIEHALSGTDEVVEAEDRDYVRAIRAESDPDRKLTIYAGAIRRIHERLAPLFLVLRDAAASEPDAAEVWDQISQRRAANMRKLATELRDTGGLRPDLSITEAADVLWATNSPDLYVLFTAGRGWSPARFEHWLAETWQRLLLSDGPGVSDGAGPASPRRATRPT
jgi:AcrR family transcriptional regulator